MKTFFFNRHEGKVETFAKKLCCSITLREDLTVHVCDKHAAWKLLSEISRTAPGAVLEGFLRFLETTQDFPSTMGAHIFSELQRFTRHTQQAE